MSESAEHAQTAPESEPQREDQTLGDQNPSEVTSGEAQHTKPEHTKPEHTEPERAETASAPLEQAAPSPAAGDATSAARQPAVSGGPISLEKIRQLRMSQQTAEKSREPKPPAPPRQQPAEASQTPSQSTSAESSQQQTRPPKDASGKQRRGRGNTPIPTPEPLDTRSKIAVPSTRQPLSRDLEEELAAALGESDLQKMLVGDDMLQVGHQLEEGQRVSGKVMKSHGEFVFVSLGGPNEGVLPSLQFETPPEEGSQLEVVVRGFLPQEGLYELTVPGNAVEVADWSDLNEGEVVEAVITAANAGGLECKVGSIRGFIPASQAAEYRIENLADMVDQKVLCVVTEANPRRGNLVLSRRAVLEREKKEKRAERLANLEVGAAVEGVVRKILDFGAFVDIGGLDGLLHISQLSWDRVKHPSEVLEEGQKIQVRVDKIDEQSGKIGLSYRALQEDPWADVDQRFPVGSIAHGTVTRIAEFGAFVRLATGVEGLVHVSELAHHRVHSVGNVVQEGQEVDVKVLAVELDKQRVSLSLKAAQAAPEAAQESAENATAEEEPPPPPVLPKHRGPLKGGTGGDRGGEQFGLKW
jgi:small subunit ribosomal protein S1